jgi:hypothetical protein
MENYVLLIALPPLSIYATTAPLIALPSLYIYATTAPLVGALWLTRDRKSTRQSQEGCF